MIALYSKGGKAMNMEQLFFTTYFSVPRSLSRCNRIFPLAYALLNG